MKVLSCFAGIGGFDLGFERAGMETVAHVEIDDYAAGVFAKHFPNSKRYEDITKFDASPYRGVDVVCGGFPCQDLSRGGKRKGLAGQRSGLYWELLRVVAESRPRVVVIENVLGLLTQNKGHDFELVLHGLEEHGYWWAYRVLDSRWFGLPQNRQRVFIVGSLGGATFRDSLFDGGEMCVLSPAYSPHGVESAERIAGTLDTRGRGRQGMWRNLVFGTTEGVRDLTRIERERVAGFPDDWTAGVSDAQSAKMTGNSVCPPVAEWIGRRIMGAA